MFQKTMPTVMTAEAFQAQRDARIFSLEKDAGGVPVAYSQEQIAAENDARAAAKAKQRTQLLIWGAVILGGGGLLLYALLRK